jgi:hypothetical protein
MPGNWLEAPVLRPMMKVKLVVVYWVMTSHPTVFSSVGWAFTFVKKLQFQFLKQIQIGSIAILKTNWNWVYSSVGLVYRIRINPWF